MKNNTILSSSVLAIVIGTSATIAPAILVAALTHSAIGAIGSFVTSAVFLLLFNDYAPRDSHLESAPVRHALSKYPLAA